MKKFYTVVTAAPLPDGGFAVHLDGRPVMTPGRVTLCAPNKALADAIMAEWAAQEDVIIPDTMPLTQILTTAIDRAIPQRAEIEAQILRYLDTDLVCYRAAHPPELAAAQDRHWAPARDWFKARMGAALQTTTGLAALTQLPAAHEAATLYVTGLDDYRFTICQMVVAVTGSLVLALAFMDGALGAEDLFDATHVEEDYKAALYNEDFYGRAPHQEQREQAVRRDLEAATRFLSLL